MGVRGMAYVLAAAALWGTLGVVARLAYAGGAQPGEVVFFRAAIAFVLALAVARRQGVALAVPRRRWLLLGAYGTISVGLFYLSYFWAVRMLPVAVAAVLLYTAPVFVALLARLFLGETLGLRRLLALAVALAGVMLVSAPDPSAGIRWGGVAVGLLSGLTYALYSIFGKVALRDLDPAAVVVYTLGIGALVLLAALPPGRLLDLAWSPAVWLWVFLLGVGPTFLAYRLYTAGLQWVPASTASIVATVEPVVAALLGWLVLGESLSAGQGAGAVLVLLAGWLAQEGLSLRAAARATGGPEGHGPRGRHRGCPDGKEAEHPCPSAG
ncbi:EamA family transporter [Thermaerobacter sp. PB12/4term]|uniref:DMT family transporter n=1 Tax=Thermaerobacter sp. PB12/4term TaxID=2293838 RepID=UPI000E327842|nr:EamA family transporter [Thermaerobacter sp. PB12/4term]QIA26598.1 EamA family transporter [Thermaerobacter sp. PB12/4term]